jgi:hypothetical protein
MPDVFANDYFDRIMKKTEKSLNNTCILYCQKWGLSWRLRLKCDNYNFCGEKTKVYTEAWNYLHVAVLNLDVKY